MFERFQKKPDSIQPSIKDRQVLDRILYPVDLDVADIVRALEEGKIKGTQINLINHEILCPREYRERIENLLLARVRNIRQH